MPARKKRSPEDFGEEIRAHLELESDELQTEGLNSTEARFHARRQFGNVTASQERFYERNRWLWWDGLRQDLRYTVRVLAKSPVFTLVAVLSLALGIGVNSAVFSVVNSVLLRPLPYPEPGQIVRLTLQGGPGAVTMREFEFWKENARTLSAVSGYRGVGERRLQVGTGQEWIRAQVVGMDFLKALNVSPALGREFTAEETQQGGPRAIILSDSLWRRTFGSDPNVAGRGVLLDRESYTVVGVLPKSFWYPQSSDALVPLRRSGSLADSGTNTEVIARLAPGVSVEQAAGEMVTITEAFRTAHSSSLHPRYRGLTVLPFQKWLVGDYQTNLWLLFGATGLLLLIACANLATLLLGRIASRGKEIALRLALGSSRGRLILQFLLENLLLCGMGAAAGLAAAYGLLQALQATAWVTLPAAGAIELDGTVLAFTLGVALLAAIVFTLVPLLAAERIALHDALKSGSRTAGAGSVRARVRNLLVTAEVALSVCLLVGAGLLIQSLYQMHQQELGFTARQRYTFDTPLDSGPRRTPAGLNAYVDTLAERLGRIPGTSGVAAANILPLTGWSNLPTQRIGHPVHSIGGMEIRLVTPSYFEVMGIEVKKGRTFTASDTASAPAVAVVNEAVVKAWWANGEAIGDRLMIGRFRGRDFAEIADTPREVIGVVANTKVASLTDVDRPTVFLPMPQASAGIAGGVGTVAWILRTSAPSGLAEEVRRTVAGLDPAQRVRRLRTLEEIVASTTARPRSNAWLFGLFAAVALALAAVGVYGVLSFAVTQRLHEIGTRIALGAQRGDVLALLLKQGLVLIAIGLIAGLLGALGFSRWMTSLLWGVKATSPAIFASVAVVLFAVGLAASYIPARRATRIDPMTALRNE